jgi:hypothetical protein
MSDDGEGKNAVVGVKVLGFRRFLRGFFPAVAGDGRPDGARLRQNARRTHRNQCKSTNASHQMLHDLPPKAGCSGY